MAEKAKILVVDDSTENRTLLKLLLEDDYIIGEADSGEACLVLVERDNPDLILLDVNMPGLNGYQVCEELRKKTETEDLPIIFVSGLDSAEERLAGFEAGGDEYLIKPVDGADLLKKVEANLKGYRQKQKDHEESNDAMNIAMEAMTVSSELGQIIEFVKSGSKMQSRQAIGEAMLKIAQEFQLNASVMVKGEEPIFIGCDPSSTEARFLIKASESSERMFSLGIRFVLRDPHIVMLIKDLPTEDENKTGRLKDHLAVLMDIADGYLVTVNAQHAVKHQRKEFLKQIIDLAEEQIEQTSNKINSHGKSSSALLQHMVSNLEEMLFSLGLEEDQEKKLMGLADQTSNELEDLNQSTKDLDKELGVILESLYQFMEKETSNN